MEHLNSDADERDAHASRGASVGIDQAPIGSATECASASNLRTHDCDQVSVTTHVDLDTANSRSKAARFTHS